MSYLVDKLPEEASTRSSCCNNPPSVSDVDSDSLGDTLSNGCDGLINDLVLYKPLVSKNSESHTQRREKAVSALAELRPRFVPAVISAADFPINVMCTFCKCNVRCKDWGSHTYLCEECTWKLHSNINLFHSPMLWKVSKLQ